jgi:hypothetical protein
MEGYYTPDRGSKKLLISLTFLSKAEGPIPSATFLAISIVSDIFCSGSHKFFPKQSLRPGPLQHLRLGSNPAGSRLD